MELKEAIEILKNLQDWYKEGNMSTTIESSELESICIVLQALEESDADKATSYLDGITFEREHWENKIKEKLIELDKSELLGRYYYEQIKIATDILKELLEGTDNLKMANIKYSTTESQRNTMRELLKGE